MSRTKKQLQLNGMERKAIKEIDTAAEAYVEARDERMQLTEREIETRGALIAVMKKHNLEVYRDGDAAPPLVITIVAGEDKVKVTRVEDEPAEEEPDA